MSISYSYLSTGLPELDALFKGLIAGDNIVWHTPSVEDYRLFAVPFCEQALANGQRVIYLRFAGHPPLVEASEHLQVHELHPEAGFEAFINAIHAVIEANGTGGFYLFDCLTDLVGSWYSDEMLGNFFKLTCPYLLDVEAIAYFGLLKQRHSQNALQPILHTTQLYIDVFRHADEIYLHPVKVQKRYSPTMHMLQHWQDGDMVPVAQSGLTSEIYHAIPWTGESSAAKVFDLWNQTFVQAEYLLTDPRGIDNDQARTLRDSLLRMVFSRDERMLELARQNLALGDLVAIGQRMIGTGLIGGKSAGMLLAQAVLRNTDPAWNDMLEQHDSFYIGSDVFYSYLVRNGCWWARQQKDLDGLLHNARHARRLILTGQFTTEMIEKLSEMLDYFGQAPILVRSSSLLEDNYGNAFSGKYESVFCPNQGSRQKCLDDLLTAIRTVYASAMSEKAIRYRAHSDLLERDEQMSLLVQRVSGGLTGTYHYPLLAGVGYSFNPYVWSEYIDAEAGVLRLVFGLGTRAVDRSDDDYTRLVALNDPLRCPDAGSADRRQFAQHKADVIDLQANRVVSVTCEEALRSASAAGAAMVATEDPELVRLAEQSDRPVFTQIVTFESLFRETDFAPRMRAAMQALQQAYGCPVDIEFTANFTAPDRYRINLVQCRPFQVQRPGRGSAAPAMRMPEGPAILRSTGPVIGCGRELQIDRILFVDPDIYSTLTTQMRYTVAHLVGKTLNAPEMRGMSSLLIGPGRWGTTTPELGVPVTFADISRAAVLCEIVMMRPDLVPDVSLGTHFFNDLVECNTLYLGLFPEQKKVTIDWGFLRTAPVTDITLIRKALAEQPDLLRVIDVPAARRGKPLTLHADSVNQQAFCGFAE